MATSVATFRDTLRGLIDDDESVQIYEDAQLDRRIRTAVLMNMLPGYKLTPDNLYVDPSVSDPNLFALLLYQTARIIFGVQPEVESYKTRGMSQVRGSRREWLWHLDHEIYRLKAGSMFIGWGSFATWYRGVTGLNLWENLTEILVRAPFQMVTITSAGASTTVNNPSLPMDTVVTFSREAAFGAGDYLLGEYPAPQKAGVIKTMINCAPSLGDAVIGLERNGTVVGVLPIPAATTHLESSWDQELALGDVVRWIVTVAPSPLSMFSLNMTVEPRYPAF